MKINKDKTKKIAKVIFSLIITFIVIKECISMISSFDMNKFK